MCPRLRFVRARAHLRAQMTQKSRAVGMCNAKLGNHLNNKLKENRLKIHIVAGHPK